jgi:hypothetical protein
MINPPQDWRKLIMSRFLMTAAVVLLSLPAMAQPAGEKPGKPQSTRAIRAAIIVATGSIVGGVLAKAPGHNEGIAAIDEAVGKAMDSLIRNANAKLGAGL